jgi:putative tryptophan/tyrosine transport system substrate-binding protein
MKRREFITLLGGAAAWPIAARAQQADRMRRIGYLSATDAPGEPQAASRRLIMEAALARLGYVEGSNLVIDRRLLSDQVELVNEAAAELLALQSDVIVAVNTPDVAADPTVKEKLLEMAARFQAGAGAGDGRAGRNPNAVEIQI